MIFYRLIDWESLWIFCGCEGSLGVASSRRAIRLARPQRRVSLGWNEAFLWLFYLVCFRLSRCASRGALVILATAAHFILRAQRAAIGACVTGCFGALWDCFCNFKIIEQEFVVYIYGLNQTMTSTNFYFSSIRVRFYFVMLLIWFWRLSERSYCDLIQSFLTWLYFGWLKCQCFWSEGLCSFDLTFVTWRYIYFSLYHVILLVSYVELEFILSLRACGAWISSRLSQLLACFVKTVRANVSGHLTHRTLSLYR